ncbi:polysaccharide deacetylase family protein [Natronincola ferrireducens]|uniref:Polysaccharide deacetylase n=1 Tax=Natronincola ferrireducens TaxID=393762 RepID=A0A1G9FY28_9FIRM|nr:polysaccharide deacetylase family protein [Natronincola ferrireducens]SDK93262.1 Polysaccharide deacetylase [Natronincola ferrireducens]
MFKKSIIIILLSIIVLTSLTLGFMYEPLRVMGSNYINRSSGIVGRISKFFKGEEAIESSKVEGLEILLDEIDEINSIENGGLYQQTYREKTYNDGVRSFSVGDDNKADSIAVLMYHHLLKEDENTLYQNNDSVITVEDFQEQMKVLHDHSYHTITLYELEQFLLGNLDLPKNTVVITFDDGYLSNIQYAYPILKEYGFKASNFLITHKLMETSEEFDPDKLQYLSWQDMVNTLDVFTYDNHTHDLHRLEDKKGYLITKPVDDVVEDLHLNMKLTDSPYFAYPYGQYNGETLYILQNLDMRMAFTVKEGPVKRGDDLLQLKRYGIFPHTGINEFKKIVGIK